MLIDLESIKEVSDYIRLVWFFFIKYYFLVWVGELKWILIYLGIGGMEISISFIIWQVFGQLVGFLDWFMFFFEEVVRDV